MPESGVTKHNYLFCQFVNPAREHEGDRCDCFDTPSQRRTTLAKQRLARLRANREINRASTSNDPESAVASDPAVTLTNLITGCVQAGHHPLLWRQAIVCAVPKRHRADYSMVKNFRPVSLLECMGKLVEKLVARMLYSEIIKHNLVP